MLNWLFISKANAPHRAWQYSFIISYLGSKPRSTVLHSVHGVICVIFDSELNKFKPQKSMKFSLPAQSPEKVETFYAFVSRFAVQDKITLQMFYDYFVCRFLDIFRAAREVKMASSIPRWFPGFCRRHRLRVELCVFIQMYKFLKIIF